MVTKDIDKIVTFYVAVINVRTSKIELDRKVMSSIQMVDYARSLKAIYSCTEVYYEPANACVSWDDFGEAVKLIRDNHVSQATGDEKDCDKTQC